ncbi:PKD domain-containing protein [Mucilaginibacter glaciei]|uniref:PKD domain-containing protein n=1 Tax=Mucilaginibacter glaciei TaxID=2772109 RepID=A0A926RZU0_9SPHI|nr:PKD domain-containing protein [Mucilaginibacter glaciei]MBD1392200.1 PKD domain-containing protein [Mucilaginibacter glaciei]
MVKNFTKNLFFLVLICFSFCSATYGQTITIQNFDIGPYGPGSTISAPFHLNNASGCLNSTNIFNLYLSDATGDFTSETLIGSYTSFYGSFVNGIIPSTAPAGVAYRVRIKTTNPGSTSAASAPFAIGVLSGTTASVSSSSVNTANPEVFGACLGAANEAYSFINKSTSGTLAAPATVNFYNELAQADEGTFPLNKTFNAKTAHYTVFVKAISATGVVGTKSYLLMNNVINNSFGASGSTTVCLSGGNSLTYNVDITSANGIQNNYPGLTYQVSWGDGGRPDTYTLCDIVNGSGKISHLYLTSSCGLLVNGQANVFEVDLQPISSFCGKVVTQVTGYAKVLAPPLNRFIVPPAACVNTPVTIQNISTAGQDPNSTTLDCQNINGRYTWSVDGNPIYTDYDIRQPFVYPFTTVGTHNITLRLQNTNGLCAAPDLEKTICVQNTPVSDFNFTSTTTCVGSALTPVNTSTNPTTCVVNPYRWTVTGPAPVTYGSGTDATSAIPNFIFSLPGTYNVVLEIIAPGCGTITSAAKTVTVNSSPIASLSPDITLCGNGGTFTFDTNPSVTRSILAGTINTLPTTYLWTVTSSNGGTYTFTGGTNANSRFPQIIFDNYASYNVTVVHTNNCGSATASQNITFQPAPNVNAGPDQTICEGSIATLAATVSGTITSQQWVGGTGTFSPDRNTLNATYTPSAAEITAGKALLTLRVTTPVPAPCNSIDDNIVINITKKDNVTSPATQIVCNGQNFNYIITATNPLTTFAWTTALTSGSASGFGASGSGSVINDLINNNHPTTDAVVTYKIVPTTAGCPGNTFTLTVSVKALPLITATVANPVICSNQPAGITFNSNQTGTTYIWSSVASAGISGNSTQTVATGTGSIQDLLTNTGTAPGTVTYSITPLNSICASAPITVSITVLPAPITSVPGPDAQICNTPIYTLQGNNPVPGTGKWTLVSGQTGVVFSDDTKPNATVSGLLPGNVYQFKWSITSSATCAPSSNIVTVTDAAETVGGILSGASTVCAGNNVGAIVLAGQTGAVLRWESSIDGGTTWIQIANGTNILNYLNLIQTTQYRAVVQNSVCSIKVSALATITVNPPAVIAAAGSDFTACNAAVITLTGNSPSPFTGVWTQTGGPAVIIVNPSSAQTQVKGLLGGNIYKFTWTIKGLPPCADNGDEIIVTNTKDVTAAFTANRSSGCGPQTITFTNTSTSLTGTTFAWDFGDGTPPSAAVSPIHTFAARTDGKEAVYNVTLNIVGNCVPHPPATLAVSISPLVPVAAILPDDLNGCGAFVLNVQNASPGNNPQYDFYLYRGATLVQHIVKTDKTDATFNAISVSVITNYRLYMVVTDKCGTTAKTTDIPITISPASFRPQTFVKNSVNRGCAPFSATFVNNSSGGDTFAYNIYDAANKLIETLPASKADFNYVFANVGTYYVTLSGTDYCTTLESTPKVRIDVFSTPQPNFKPDVTIGCTHLKVTFTNLTTADAATPASSLVYDWDFGDGTHSSAYNPAPHTYGFGNSPYTVTLTVTNSSSLCTNVAVKSNLITVNSPPNVAFTAKQGLVTEIPNYRFDFVDQTIGTPVAWNWNFGDGDLSNSQNPAHTYADTGKYVVTLRVTNVLGCDSTIKQTVQIKGVPGQLYLPNAFTPDGLSNELKVFTVKGSGLLKWNLQIYNNWGQLVWQTNKLNSQGQPIDSWDGTFKGQPAPQGVYIWQASATFINGTEWKGMSYNSSLPKRSGSIHLIR